MSTSINDLRIHFRELFQNAVLPINSGERTSLFLEDIIHLSDVELLALTDSMVDWITIEGDQLVADTPAGIVTLPFDHVVMTYNNRITGNVGIRLTQVAPSIATLPRQSLMEGQPFAIDVAPYLNRGAPLATLTAMMPTWVSRNGTVFSGTPPDRAMARTEQIVITLTNVVGSDTGTLFLDIANNLVPRPVTIRTIPLQTGTELQAWSFDVSPYLVEGHPAGTFEWTSVPTWATTNGRVVSGTIPDQTQATDWTFTFRWFNSNSDETANVTLRVGDTHFAPVWQSIPDQLAIIGQAYSINLNNFVSGGPDTPVVDVISIVPGYSDANGIFSGFGSVMADLEVRARATNSQGTTDTTFRFRARPENQAPSISTIPQQMLNEGDMFSLDVETYLDRGSPTATLMATTPSWVSQSGSVFSGTVPNRGMDIREQINLRLENTVDIATGNVELVIGNTLFPPEWQNIPVQNVVQGNTHSVNTRNFVAGGPAPVITSVNPLPDGFTLVNDVLTTDGSLFGIHDIELLATNPHGTDTTTVQFRIEPDQAGDFPTMDGRNGIAFINNRFFILQIASGVNYFREYSMGGLYLRRFSIDEATLEGAPFITGAAADNTYVYALNSGVGLFGYNPTTGVYANQRIAPASRFNHQRSAFFYENYVWVVSWNGRVNRYQHGQVIERQFTVPGYDANDTGTRISASAEVHGYFWYVRENRELVVTDDQGRVYDELGVNPLSKIPTNHRPVGATIAYNRLYVLASSNVYHFPITLRAPNWGTDNIPTIFPNVSRDFEMRDYVAHNGIPKADITVIPEMTLPSGFTLTGTTLTIDAAQGTYDVPLRIANSQGHDDRTFSITVAYPTEIDVGRDFRGITKIANVFYGIERLGNLYRFSIAEDGATLIGNTGASPLGYEGLTAYNNNLYALNNNRNALEGVNPANANRITSLDIANVHGGRGATFGDGSFWAINDISDRLLNFTPGGAPIDPAVNNVDGDGLAYVDVGIGFLFLVESNGEVTVVDSNKNKRPNLDRTFTASSSPTIRGAVYAFNAVYIFDDNDNTVYRKEILEVPVWDDDFTYGVIANQETTINVFDYLNTELVGLSNLTSTFTGFDPETGELTITLSSGSTNVSLRAENPLGSDDIRITFEVQNALTEFPLHPDNTDPQALDFYDGHHYVLDGTGNRIYVYDQLGRRIRSRETELDATLFNGLASGLAIIGNLAYIARGSNNSKLYVWNLTTKVRQTSSEFNVHGPIQGIERGSAGHILASRVDANVQYITTYDLSGSQVSNIATPVLLATALIRGLAADLGNSNLFASGANGTIYVYNADIMRQSAFDFMAADIRGLHYRSNRLWGVDSTHIRSWVNPVGNTFEDYTGTAFELPNRDKRGLAVANYQIITTDTGTNKLEIWGSEGLVRSHDLNANNTHPTYIAYRNGYIYILDSASLTGTTYIYIYRHTGEYVGRQQINLPSLANLNSRNGMDFGHESGYIYIGYSTESGQTFTDYTCAYAITGDTTITANPTVSERITLGSPHVYAGEDGQYHLESSGMVYTDTHYHLVSDVDVGTTNVQLEEEVYVYNTSGSLQTDRIIDVGGKGTVHTPTDSGMSFINLGDNGKILILTNTNPQSGDNSSTIRFFDLVVP